MKNNNNYFDIIHSRIVNLIVQRKKKQKVYFYIYLFLLKCSVMSFSIYKHFLNYKYKCLECFFLSNVVNTE